MASCLLTLPTRNSNPQHASPLISLHTAPVGKRTPRVSRALFTLLSLPHTQFIMRGGSTGSRCSTLTVPEGESWQPRLSTQPYVPSQLPPTSWHGSMPSGSSLAEGADCPRMVDCCQSHSHAKRVVNTCSVFSYQRDCARCRVLSER